MPYYMDFDPEDLLTSEGEDTATSEGEDTADSKGEVKASLEDVNDIASSEDVNNTASEDDKKVNRFFGYVLHQILKSGEMSKGFEKPVDWHEELMLFDDDDDVNEKEQKWIPHTQTYVGEKKMQLGQPELVVIDGNKTQEMQLKTSELVEDEVPTALKVEDAAASMGKGMIFSEDVDKSSSEDVEEVNHVDGVLTLY